LLFVSCKGEIAAPPSVETVTVPPEEARPANKVSIPDPIGKFDWSFKRWGEWYFPFEDWHWWKSQGIAESNLDPSAVSWCGAVGIMQIMPATATDLGVKNRWDAEESIQGGIKYDSQIWKWWDRFCSGDKKKITFASYNAGMGNIKKAKEASNSCDWENIKTFLSGVTGKHSVETVNYVKRIYKVKESL
jgi:membrane-bound lytic murein transglycosylase F